MDRIELLKRYLQEDPDDSFTSYALSLEYIRLKDYQQAKSILVELNRKDPDYLAAYYQLGKVYESLQLTEEAVSVYEKGMLVARSQKNHHTFSELDTALKQIKGDPEEEE
ncbi:MAG: tetratricopeptide repeat protein [Bacteroidetes bacterium]|nr:tetratricopeptide repeat protein [Bacteroidota bacterium]MBL0066585.1 tetratricopeptide repeat protein [Bacteroidota bacterium]MBL0138761.1 tetratricopeptide repeat protein [Bacteroidota bacterium]